MMFQFYAQGWFILGLTSSAALLGFLGVTRGTGMLIFGLFGGALADRMDRRQLLMATQSAAMVVFGLLSALVLLDRISLWPALGLIFVAASVESVDAPARQALLPHLVPREHIPNAVALFIAAQVSSYAFLPPLAGVAIEYIGAGGAFAVSLIGHAVVIVALLLMRARPEAAARTESMLLSVARGVSHAAAKPDVLWLLVFSMAVGTLGFPIISTLAPFWMKNELGLGPVGWTFMGWIWGLGTLASTVYLSTHDMREKLGPLVLLSALGFGMTLVVFGLTRWMPLAAAMWCLNGTFYTANMISTTSLVQLLVEGAYVGRVMSLRMVSGALNQIASAPLGALGDAVGMGTMVPATAALLAGIMVVVPLLVREARELRAPPEPRAAAPASAG